MNVGRVIKTPVKTLGVLLHQLVQINQRTKQRNDQVPIKKYAVCAEKKTLRFRNNYPLCSPKPTTYINSGIFSREMRFDEPSLFFQPFMANILSEVFIESNFQSSQENGANVVLENWQDCFIFYFYDLIWSVLMLWDAGYCIKIRNRKIYTTPNKMTHFRYAFKFAPQAKFSASFLENISRFVL